MKTSEQKKNNLRLALILACVALAFSLGYAGRVVFFGV